MDPLTIILALLFITFVTVLIPFFAVEKISQRFADKSKRSSTSPRNAPPCTCHAGSHQPNKYYHAYTCRYRQYLELET